MKRKQNLQIAYFRGMVDFWRLHLPPGWTIKNYTCEQIEEMIEQLESVQAEMDVLMHRIHVAQTHFEETAAMAECVRE